MWYFLLCTAVCLITFMQLRNYANRSVSNTDTATGRDYEWLWLVVRYVYLLLCTRYSFSLIVAENYMFLIKNRLKCVNISIFDSHLQSTLLKIRPSKKNSSAISPNLRLSLLQFACCYWLGTLHRISTPLNLYHFELWPSKWSCDGEFWE